MLFKPVHHHAPNRREILQFGGLGTLGLSLPGLLAARGAPAAEIRQSDRRTFGRAKRCILLFMWGGPPHQDTFDMKPDAPVEIRGEFRPIPTNVPGISVSDHLPLLSRCADKFAIVRSVTHANGEHISQCHDMLTGNAFPGPINTPPTAARTDHPHIGAVMQYLKPRNNGLPAYVQIPCLLQSNSGKVIPGQNGGFLGNKYDPYMLEAAPNKTPSHDPDFLRFRSSSFNLPEEVSARRLRERGGLRDAVDRGLAQRGSGQDGFDSFYQQAVSLVTSNQAKKAFNLGAEDPDVVDRYGRHTFGQGVLRARRLVEAGVPLVTVYWPNGPNRTDIGWDNHINNFPNLKNWQLPPVDQAVSALLEDLAQTGQLDDTLVVWMGEFGRSPGINDNGGRDHWPYVYSVVLAGGGVRGGEVYGLSDRSAAYPLEKPVAPIDLGATLYHFLGIDGETLLHDPFQRPHPVCRGTPIAGLI